MGMRSKICGGRFALSATGSSRRRADSNWSVAHTIPGYAVEQLSPCRPDHGVVTTDLKADFGRRVAGSSVTLRMVPSVCCEMSRSPGTGEMISCVSFAPGSGYSMTTFGETRGGEASESLIAWRGKVWPKGTGEDVEETCLGSRGLLASFHTGRKGR
jgi:hypothetical protein